MGLTFSMAESNYTQVTWQISTVSGNNKEISQDEYMIQLYHQNQELPNKMMLQEWYVS